MIGGATPNEGGTVHPRRGTVDPRTGVDVLILTTVVGVLLGALLRAGAEVLRPENPDPMPKEVNKGGPLIGGAEGLEVIFAASEKDWS